MKARRPAEFSLPVLFADEHVLAVDKPAGLLSVPPAGGGEKNVADRLRRQAQAKGEEVFAVHRLDRDTSGVLLFARGATAREALERAFRERAVHKLYLALVNGLPRPPSGTIRTYITEAGGVARSSRTPSRAGKLAITRYRVVERFAQAALVEAVPETGRFNQIRVHLAGIGCPLVGERKYAIASRLQLRHGRPLLHAAALTFPHPASGQLVTVRAEPPADFAQVLCRLRG